jgi:hypothetical protein
MSLSAKHKRPFAVFAAVAIMCAMVVITGVRSKADVPPVPEADSNRVSTSGTIEPLPESHGPITPEADPGSTSDFGDGSQGATDTRPPGEFEEPTPPSDDGGSDNGNGTADPLDGVISLPPLVLPDPDDALPGDDETDAPDDDGKGKGGKGRGGRGKDGKDGKDDQDGKGEGDQTGDEEPLNADELPDEPVDEGTLPEEQSDLEVDGQN